MTRHHSILAALTSASCLIGLSVSAYAVDVQSSDFVPAPAGTNLLVIYNQYTTSDEYKSTNGTKISANTGIDTYIDTLRYVRYVDIFGLTGTLQVILPVGTLYNARVGGAELDAAAGIADPILANGLWLLNDPGAGRYIALCQFLFIPVGQYESGESLNLGENRWKYELQGGFYQSLGNNFALQVVGDVLWYGANDSAGNGYQRLTQDNTYNVQMWLSYTWDESWRVGFGYTKYFGGTEYLDGVPTGNATQKDQVRLELSKFITPTFQVLGNIQRDIDASGGFPEKLRAMVRLTQVF